MYYAWKHHHLRPKEYYDLAPGEKAVLQAFYYKEMEEKKEQAEAVAESGMCPAMMLI